MAAPASSPSGKVIVGAVMSLDGFMAGPGGDLSRLYPDMAAMRETKMLQDAIRMTGAVVMGRRTYAMGEPDAYDGDYEFQVPIFVVTHAAPNRLPRQDARLTFTFVTDGVESAIRQARAAAGGRNVTVVGGASTLQQCLQLGLADEVEISLRPVLLGGGLRLFEHLSSAPIELEIFSVDRTRLTTDLRYRVVRSLAAA